MDRLFNIPKEGCTCFLCEEARKAEQGKEIASAKQAMIDAPKAMADRFAMPAYVPFEPEPAAAPEPEPVYTHLLIDFAEDGTPEDVAELHTAESALGAIALRQGLSDTRFQIFKLGDLVLDIAPSE